MHRTTILTDYLKKFKVTNFALCDVAFFTLKNHVFCEMCKYKVFFACRKITASQDFQELSDLNSICAYLLYQVSSKSNSKSGKCVQKLCYLLIMCGFHCTDFSETYNHSVIIVGYFLFQISSEPDKEM